MCTLLLHGIRGLYPAATQAEQIFCSKYLYDAMYKVQLEIEIEYVRYVFKSEMNKSKQRNYVQLYIDPCIASMKWPCAGYVGRRADE